MRSATARVLNADFGVQRQGQLESLKRLGQFAKYLVGLAANPMRDSAPVGPLSTIGKGRIGGTQGISLYTTPLSHKLPRELDACGEVDDALHAQPDGFDTRLPVPLTRQKASQAGH